MSATAGTQPSDLVMLTESEVFGIYRYQLVDGTYERMPITTTTTEHHYVTQNGKVVRETIGTGSTAKVLDFIYDERGKPFALKYSANGGSSFTTYYYVLNLQGDVVAIMNTNQSIVAKYSYTAWGDVLAVTYNNGSAITGKTHIGNLNPIRYRGYYYDTETGFYYLQSRYYDPMMRRFINADSYQSTGQGILGTNMFSYCGNNPVAYQDYSGKYRTYSVAESDTGYLTDLGRMRIRGIMEEERQRSTAYHAAYHSTSLKFRYLPNGKGTVDASIKLEDCYNLRNYDNTKYYYALYLEKRLIEYSNKFDDIEFELMDYKHIYNELEFHIFANDIGDFLNSTSITDHCQTIELNVDEDRFYCKVGMWIVDAY